MPDAPEQRRRRPIRFLFENSIFLLVGAVVALFWANIDPDQVKQDGQIVQRHSYGRFVHFAVLGADEAHHPAGEQRVDDLPILKGWTGTLYRKLIQRPDGEGHAHGVTIHFLVNDLLMALFFAIAACEVWEALLPGGALSNPRKAVTPLMATLGGIIGPVAIYLGGVIWFQEYDTLGRGWAVPCATDIAFSYLVARFIFGAGHPAIVFLLLLAIADDAAGLAILAIAYPIKPIDPTWFLLTIAAMGSCFLLRRFRLHSFWWYLLLPGMMCWISFDMAGVHPALGLVPIIPCLPHAHTDLGLFAREELSRKDTLSEFVAWWKNPVELILGLFGIVNAGVVFSSMGTGTWMVLAGLLIGKPLGIAIFTWISKRVFKLEMPDGMTYRHVVVVGVIAGIGFTVALFVSTAAFHEPGPVQDSVKMGALLSFVAALLAILMARILKIRPFTGSIDDLEPAEKRVEDDDASEDPPITPDHVPAI